jgi:hypothetical protein
MADSARQLPNTTKSAVFALTGFAALWSIPDTLINLKTSPLVALLVGVLAAGACDGGTPEDEPLALAKKLGCKDKSKDKTKSKECPDVGGTLAGFVFTQPCSNPDSVGGSCNVASATREESVQMGGDPARVYRATLHFCGPVEGRRYTGCTSTQGGGLFCPDGVPENLNAFDANYPSYQMQVSDPPRTYVLNNRFAADTILKIDYDATIEIRGGATVTFRTTSANLGQYTARRLDPPITCPGVPGITQPYAGQFVHVTVPIVE